MKTTLILLAILLPQILNAQLVNDFRVNDDTTDRNLESSLGIDEDGNFIVTWEDYRNGRANIYFQRYSSNANPIDINTKINVINDTAFNPQIAVAQNGNFAVCWNENNNFTPFFKIRFYNKYAIPFTPPIIYNDSIAGVYQMARITVTQNNIYIATWKNRSSINGQDKIYFQMFDSLGNIIGNNVRVDDTISTKDNPDIASLPDGRFVITWQDSRPPSLFTNDIFMQIFDANGNKIGVNQRVNDNLNPEDHQLFPKISSDTSGRFVIGWTDYNNNSIDSYIQLYNSNGTKKGNNIGLDGFGYEGIRTLNKRANGEFIVIYGDDIGFNYTQYCQRFDTSGQVIGTRYLLTTYPVDDVFAESVKIFQDRVVATWSDERIGNLDVYCNIRSFTNPDSTVGINQISSEVPEEYKLFQNYPNPFNPSTNIRFDISKSTEVKLAVYDITGREVSVLVNEKLNSGSYEYSFNAKELSSGVYIYKIKAADFVQTGKMLLVK